MNIAIKKAVHLYKEINTLVQEGDVKASKDALEILDQRGKFRPRGEKQISMEEQTRQTTTIY